MTVYARFLLRLAVLALGISAPALAQDFCRGRDTNQLVWNKDFQRAITSYFGDRKAYLFWQNATIAQQVLAGLGGSPDPLQKIDANTVLASACRHHSCMEKAAVVIACPSTIMSVGVIHYACESGRLGCAEKPILTIYSDEEAEGDRASLPSHRTLVKWARDVLEPAPQSIDIRMEGATVYPADVMQFMERRVACDHFRGEEPYDLERRIFLEKQMKVFCTGSDARLNSLKRKYRRNAKVSVRLRSFEAQIERPSP